jgi:hypothetical protein
MSTLSLNDMRELLQDHGKSGAGSKKAVEARFNKMVGTKQVKKNNKTYLEQQTVVSLKAVLRYHKLPISGSKPALIARLVEAGLDSPEGKKQDMKSVPKVKKTSVKKPKSEKTYLEYLPIKDLKAILKKYGMPISGTKSVLVARLVEKGIDNPTATSDFLKHAIEPIMTSFEDEPSFEEINGRPRMTIEDLYNPEYMIPRKQYPKEKSLFKLRGKSTPTPRAALQAQLKPALAEWYALKTARQELINSEKSRDMQKELSARLVMRDRLGSIQNEDPEYPEEAATYMKKPSLSPSVAKRPAIIDSSSRLGGDMYPHPSDPEEYDFYKDMVEPHVLLNNYIASFFRIYNNPNITSSSLSSLTNDAKNIFDLLDTYESINGEPATITFELSNGMQLNADTGGFFEAIDILRPFLS